MRYRSLQHQQQVGTVGSVAAIISSEIAQTEVVGAAELAEAEPADADHGMAVAAEADQAEAVADEAEDVAELAVAEADAVDQAEAGRTGRVGKEADTQAAQCKTSDVISVGTEITSKRTVARKRQQRQHESLRPWRRRRSQNSCWQTLQAAQVKQRNNNKMKSNDC